MKGATLLYTIAILTCFTGFFGLTSCRQGTIYTTANAHSHNDYEQDTPFAPAYRAGFGSIEADVFLRNGELFVAHNAVDIRPEKTLEALYLKPLAEVKEKRKLQLLIDLKTGADSTLPVLIRQLAGYTFINGGQGQKTVSEDQERHSIKVVISGNRPAPKKWPAAPGFIYFDGRPAETYTGDSLEKVGLISDSFRNYTDWDGRQPLDNAVKHRLREVVQKAHDLGKPFRFWAVPDTPQAWELMTELEVDYINTDKIEELAAWLEKRG